MSAAIVYACNKSLLYGIDFWLPDYLKVDLGLTYVIYLNFYLNDYQVSSINNVSF